MNVVFTIVAKNYLPLARALSWSIKNNNTTPVNFIIFLADEHDNTVDLNNPDETIIPVTDLGISELTDWAFKYTVTEFCTAVKPACFKHVFDKLDAEKAIYFDPDIFVFNNLVDVFKLMEFDDVVVTPHYLTPQVKYIGDQKETMTLFVGIYNFGFVAIKNSAKSAMILDWWENRLSDQCYADRQDALHTDQKWADFFPVYVEKFHISKSLGYNLAPWNLFEREIFKKDDKFWVKNRFSGQIEPLVFVHFAGFDPSDMTLIHKDFWTMPISKYPDYDLVRKIYVDTTNRYLFNEQKKMPYSYAAFSNGVAIKDQHRRLYRALTEDGQAIDSPFLATGRFYGLLQSSGMITKTNNQKFNSKTYNNFEGQLKKVNMLLKFLYKTIGSEKYFLLMKLMNRYSRPENQTFLLNEKITKIY